MRLELLLSASKYYQNSIEICPKFFPPFIKFYDICKSLKQFKELQNIISYQNVDKYPTIILQFSYFHALDGRNTLSDSILKKITFRYRDPYFTRINIINRYKISKETIYIK